MMSSSVCRSPGTRGLARNKPPPGPKERVRRTKQAQGHHTIHHTPCHTYSFLIFLFRFLSFCQTLGEAAQSWEIPTPPTLSPWCVEPTWLVDSIRS